MKHGSPTRPVPGYDVRVLDDDGNAVPTGETGHITLKLPLPPGCLKTLWQNDAGFASAYLERFPGYYQTSDAGYKDEDGYLFVMARTDDIINVAGHRLSTGAMEEVIAEHPDVAECAVIGVADALKGQLPLGFAVLPAEAQRDEAALARKVIGGYIAYAFHRVGEVTDDIDGIDRIMGMGFNWAPPCVLVDVMGAPAACKMIDGAGLPVPPALETAARTGEPRRFFQHPSINTGRFFVAG